MQNPNIHHHSRGLETESSFLDKFSLKNPFVLTSVGLTLIGGLAVFLSSYMQIEYAALFGMPIGTLLFYFLWRESRDK